MKNIGLEGSAIRIINAGGKYIIGKNWSQVYLMKYNDGKHSCQNKVDVQRYLSMVLSCEFQSVIMSCFSSCWCCKVQCILLQTVAKHCFYLVVLCRMFKDVNDTNEAINVAHSSVNKACELRGIYISVLDRPRFGM